MSGEKVKQLVKAEGKTRILEMDDGSVVERTGGSVAWRNNNPGNMKFVYSHSADATVKTSRTKEDALGDAQKLYKGVVALDQWGNAVFESREAGRAAQVHLLERKMGGKTVEEAQRVYSSTDYSGKTNYNEQADYIFKYGDRHGVDLRHKKISDMSEKEKGALADGIAGFEGWSVGQTKQVSGPKTQTQSAQTPTQTIPSSSDKSRSDKTALPSAAVLNEAEEHFFRSGKRFEYGRPDLPRPGRDSSRLERDEDGDGKLGVDCSSFVWRSLKDAGYDVKGKDATDFNTAKLFKGSSTTAYAKEHFDVLLAADARKPGGNLQPGDILMFSASGGRHVGIFKEYGDKGQIKFIGAQTKTGPAEATIKPHGYWDGDHFRIVGALRAKPEFQVRQPLHGVPESVARTSLPKSGSTIPDGRLSFGENGADVKALQQRLVTLGIKDDSGKLLTGTGYYGEHTKQAVTNLQKERGLYPSGVADKATLAAMNRTAHDGKLGFGEQGADVKGLQQNLIKLGIKDNSGKLLTGTGYYGEHTKQAVTNFQKHNGLYPSGEADKATLTAIGKKLPEGKVTVDASGVTGPDAKIIPPSKPVDKPLISNAAHPNHALYEAIGGKLPNGTRPEVAANVTLQAMENGITGVDKLGRIDVRGNDVFVQGALAGDKAKVDLQAPTPTLQQMSEHMAVQTQQLQTQQKQQQQSQPNQEQKPIVV